MEQSEKKKLWIFIALAYGVTAAMTYALYHGRYIGTDTTNVVNAQMMYPACGVILGKLICRKKEEELPILAYYTVLATTALTMLFAIASVVIPIPPIETEVEGVTMEVWSLLGSFPIMIGSVLAYIFFWTCKKKKRANAGMSHVNLKESILMIALFIALFFGRTFCSVFLTDLFTHSHDSWNAMKENMGNPRVWLAMIGIPFNFFFSWIAFFGEEYGWRYYLQPMLQKKMGARLGILVLGLVWAVYHINVDFLYYTVEDGPAMFVSQIITCVSISIFWGFLYMKTGNLWVIIICHYLNNTLAAALGGGTTDALKNQHIPWISVPIHLLSSIVFMLFLLAPIYSEKRKEEEEREEEKEEEKAEGKVEEKAEETKEKIKQDTKKQKKKQK